jgi:hypothetical protein
VDNPEFKSWQEQDISLSPDCPDWLWGPRNLSGYQGSFSRVKYWDIMFATHLHIAPWLSMSAAIPLLFVYAFTAWTGTTFIGLKLKGWLSLCYFMFCKKYYFNKSYIFCEVYYYTLFQNLKVSGAYVTLRLQVLTFVM